VQEVKARQSKKHRAKQQQQQLAQAQAERAALEQQPASMPLPSGSEGQASNDTVNSSIASLFNLFHSFLSVAKSTHSNATSSNSTLIEQPVPSRPLSSSTSSRSTTYLQEDHTSSFSSGNETDREEDAPPIAGVAGGSSQIAAAYGSGSDEDAAVASSPVAKFVPCSYAEFGCESLVPASTNGSGMLDAHYQASYQHHLSLLQAKHSIVQSQKSQLALLLEQEYRAREVAQRKLERREERYAKLKKKAALARVQHTKTAEDLVAQFLVGDPAIDAALQIRDLTEELARVREELALKDKLLVEAAQYIGGQQQQLSASPPQPQQASAEPEPEAELEEEPLEPPFQPSHPFILPSSVTQSLPSQVPVVLHHAAHGHSHAHHHAIMQQHPSRAKLNQMAQQQAQAQAYHSHVLAQKEAQREAYQREQSQVVYFAAPHPALKALAPMLNSATFASVFGVGNGASQQRGRKSPAVPSHSSAVRRTTDADQPGGRPQSRGAKLGLSPFCPQTWLKKMSSTVAPPQRQGAQRYEGK
jgi:hypothetical protein